MRKEVTWCAIRWPLDGDALVEVTNPIDNVGIPYGLSILQQGRITPAQSVDLQQKIGGFTIDIRPQAARTIHDTVRIFATGVCDWSVAGDSQQGAVEWMTYQNAAGGVIYGGTPLPAAPADSGDGLMSPAFRNN